MATCALALGAVVTLGACSKSDKAPDTTMAATTDTAMTTGTGSMSATAQSTTPSTAPLTDAGIMAMLTAANQGEIAAGKLAESKATNASVRSFAHDMVTAHTEMLNSGEALAKKLNITPDSAAAASMRASNDSTATALNAAAKGAAFDSAYVNAQVSGHEAVLDLIKRAESAAQNADLKTALKTDETKVQSHLDRIRNIQGKM
jgi:putative membrane protein